MQAIEFANCEETEGTHTKIECSRCQSTSDFAAKGLRWVCKACGKQFMKIKRRSPIGKRPSCPECGNSRPHLNGRNLSGDRVYLCTKCGRNYTEASIMKMIRNQVEISTEVEIE